MNTTPKWLPDFSVSPSPHITRHRRSSYGVTLHRPLPVIPDCVTACHPPHENDNESNMIAAVDKNHSAMPHL